MFYKRQEYLIKTNEELQKLALEWCEYLNLSNNWDIVFNLERKSGIKDGCQADCDWTLGSNTAIINIMDHIDWENKLFPQDMEVSLVHELLHLYFCTFDNTKDDSAEHIRLEQTIETLAKSLVNLKRLKG
jgi:hypothetical protein